jgi:hypothetical protein
MKDTDKTDLDLDVVNMTKYMSEHQNEKSPDALFYLRMEGKRLFVSFYGTDVDLINSFITAMESQDGMYDLLSTATEAYEQDCACVITEE